MRRSRQVEDCSRAHAVSLLFGVCAVDDRLRESLSARLHSIVRCCTCRPAASVDWTR